jgi:hypothetical protein
VDLLRPGNGFVLNTVTVADTVDLSFVVSLKDTDIVSGAYLSLTTATNTTTIADTKLGANLLQYANRTIEFTENANATSLPNVGAKRIISAHAITTGAMTLGKALIATPQVGDKYKVNSPVPRGCSKIYFYGISGIVPTVTTKIPGTPVTFTCADGWRCVWLYNETSNTPTILPTPIEIDLAAHGDCTILLDSTASWTVNSIISLFFYAC